MKHVTYDALDNIIYYHITINDLNMNPLKVDISIQPGNDGKWFTSDDELMRIIYEYDSKGRCIKEYNYHNSILQNVLNHVYNSDGNKIISRMYDANEITLVRCDHYTYDNDKFTEVRMFSDEDQQGLISYNTYEYDGSGNQIKETYYNSNNLIWLYYISEYKDNKRIKTIDSSNNYSFWEYNSNGELIKIRSFNNMDALLNYTLVTYY